MTTREIEELKSITNRLKHEIEELTSKAIDNDRTAEKANIYSDAQLKVRNTLSEYYSLLPPSK